MRGEHALTRALFLRLVGLVYVIAFASLWVQVDGLIGSGGILPAAEFLDGIRAHAGEAVWWALPTLLWIGASDAALHALCGAGLTAALAVIVGAAPALGLAAAWACYLSLVLAGQAFLSFQWDALLLETGFLTLLWAPWSLRPRWAWADPPRIVQWLLRALLFRLMFSSGLVKLVSGDTAWRELTALTFHYQTQPLPAWTSYYAHALPEALHIFSVAAMFFIELVLPWCVVAPRRLRLWGAGGLIALQCLIGVTGNYGFFNLLSVALCLVLLDDAALRRIIRLPFAAVAVRQWPTWVLWPVAVLLLLLGGFQLSRTARLNWSWPAPVEDVYGWIRPFYLVNFYGLFAAMTTERPEIQIEGSHDGATWRVYRFRWKPGAIDQAPAFVQPHMPRLDWQMWFAALGTYRDYPWFMRLMGALLEGKAAVLGLLEENPFPDALPRYVRARLYDYRFADLQQQQAGQWWQRHDKGLYCPVVELSSR